MDSTTVTKAAVDTTSHIAKTVNDVFNAIAAHLSVPATHIWQILVRQAYVTAYTDLGLFLFLLVIFIPSAILCRKSWVTEKQCQNDHPYNSVDPSWPTLISTTMTILSGIGIVVMGILTINAMAQLANPEYSALQTILSAMPH